MAYRVFNVLFLCTANSARSILAEAILNHASGGRYRAYSAGSHPGGRVNPYALQVLERNGIDTDGLRSKDWSEFAKPDAPAMDFVLTVCDNAAGEVCPIWPGHPISGHWGVPDPAAVQGTEADKERAFADAFIALNRRIALFLNLPFDKLDKLSLQHEVRRIGTIEGASAQG